MSRRRICLGFEEDFQVNLGTGNINAVYPINRHEYIATTSKEIFKFERNEIKMQAQYSFSASTFIRPAQLVVGITTQKHEFVVLPINNFQKPELQGYNSNHLSVFHIIFSEKSNSLITFGAGIKVWHINFPDPNARLNEKKEPVTISLVSSFLNTYDTPILNCPTFDFEEEHILLPIGSGVQRYDLKGNNVSTITKTPTTKATVISYLPEKHRTLQIDTTNSDVCIWSSTVFMTKRISFVPDAVISVWAVDKEYAILLTADGHFYAMNLKTSKFTRVYSSQVPSRIIYINNQGPMVITMSGTQATFLRVIIPWQLWTSGVIRPRLIERCPRKNAAARILVFTENSFMKLYSPRTRKQMTSATPSVSSAPLQVLYDRSAEGGTPRDELFATLADGTVCGFDTGTSPATEVMRLELKSVFIVKTVINGFCKYAATTPRGDLMICNYDTWEIEKRQSLANANVINFLKVSKYLVVAFEEELMIVDPVTFEITDRMQEKVPKVLCSHNEFIFLGHSSGRIQRLMVTENGQFKDPGDGLQRHHEGEITGISFGSDHWLSVGVDGVLNVWRDGFVCVASVTLPVPLYGVCFLNGFRDILVGTDSEVMVIRGSLIFADKDAEDKEMDNYDKLIDALSSEALKPNDDDAAVTEGVLAPKQKQKPKRKNTRIEAFRAAAAIREAPPPAFTFKTSEKDKDAEELERMRALEEMRALEMSPVKPPTVSEIEKENDKNTGNDQNKENEEYEYVEEEEEEESPEDKSKKMGKKTGKQRGGKSNNKANSKSKSKAKSKTKSKSTGDGNGDESREEEEESEIVKNKEKEAPVEVTSELAKDLIAEMLGGNPRKPKNEIFKQKDEENEEDQNERRRKEHEPKRQNDISASEKDGKNKKDIKDDKDDLNKKLDHNQNKEKTQSKDNKNSRDEISDLTDKENSKIKENNNNNKNVEKNKNGDNQNQSSNDSAPSKDKDLNDYSSGKSQADKEEHVKIETEDKANKSTEHQKKPSKMPRAPHGKNGSRSPRGHNARRDPGERPIDLTDEARVRSSQSDSRIYIDPAPASDEYRRAFFQRDKGYAMSQRTFKTVIPRPVKIPDNAPSPHLWMPRRPPTPPPIRRWVRLVPPARVVRAVRRPASRGGEVRNPLIDVPPANIVLDMEEVHALYGRGHHELLPLIAVEGKLATARVPLAALPPQPAQRRKRASMPAADAGSRAPRTLRESLIITQIDTTWRSESPKPLSARPRIIVPFKGKKPK